MTENTTAIIVAIIGSGIITKLIDVWLEWRKSKKNPMKDGVKFCLLNALRTYGEGLVARGDITSLELSAFEEAYQTYKALDGDGYADKLKEDVKNLPLKV